ncbi:glycoside hydrolase family 5 protein [Gymnopilus junonius]|uniref:Glycoside hydrolase family 5 protein n=1 Tax=Gymnopilus junonius TaxID=109634 RepID=A0A9P5TSW0_GYMJU|nr:glycoside hydrolase family 5 protein [Gymnopilus junonius]
MRCRFQRGRDRHCQRMGSLNSSRSVLERHWDTFITQADFDYLANIGINTVRLPIGYWNLGPDYVEGTAFEAVGSVYQNCWPRIVRAINQAGKAGLGVLVDLHGAPGSQNGQPHSGISDGQTHLFDVPANMDKTVNVLTFLAKTFAPVNNVVGIQLLNEPQYGPTLEDFYTRAIEVIRYTSSLAGRLPLYLHDGFDVTRFSKFVAARTDFIVQDHHSYFVFTPSDKAESGSQHLVDVNSTIAESLLQTAAAQRRNLVVDEWSCALTPESLQKDDNADAVQKQFGAEQMRVYSNATAGWAFWCKVLSPLFAMFTDVS